MTDSFISSVHIQKLGHKLQEIRERALFNIISKLENGFVYDNDLARSREILSKLFQWFEFKECSHEEDVLKLIRRILTSDSGATLIKHYGFKIICDEIRQMRSRIDTRLYREVNELLAIVENCTDQQVDIPPLLSEVPLSYRTGDDALSPYPIVGATATPIEGLVHQSSSLEQQMGIPGTSNEALGDLSPIEDENNNFSLRWQPLIASDRHVLESVEQALKHPSDPSALLHSCEFFFDVMLQDFPAEVFLQRPAIILLFLDYIKASVSTRLTNSILSCFLKLTKCIKIRIHYYSDPSTYTSKENTINDMDNANYSPTSNRNSPYMSNLKVPHTTALTENTELLKSKQLLVPQYCFITMISIFDFISIKPKTVRGNSDKQKQNGNLALVLLDELISLLSLLLTSNAWGNKTAPNVVELLRVFEKVLRKFAEAIDHFRLEVTSDESNVISRISFLRLLCNCSNLLTNLIPIDAADQILPKSMKNALSDCLLDPALSRLYPSTHETILQFVKGFGGHFEADAVSKYRDVNQVCNSMTSAINFFRNYASLPFTEAIKLAKEAVKSLDFLKNVSFISSIIQLCSDHLPACVQEEFLETTEDVVLKLLAHNNKEICEQTYKECEKRVIAAIGPKYNTSGTGAPGSQVLFLLRPSILIEITLHGLTATNKTILKCADNILVHILKCKILVIEDIWNKVIQAVIPVLSLLACFANKKTALGRTVTGIMDPDIGKSLLMPPIEVLKGNLCLLYVHDRIIHEEALSRLLWILTSQHNSHDLLPRLNSLQNKSLSNIFCIQKTVTVNKGRSTQQFYQASALYQVLEMLETQNIEPMIRRSALTQVSVMVEDPRLHYTFLERNGVNTILSAMESALNENDYKDYVDCVIPSISILKSLCLYSSGVRQDLSNNFDGLCNILRGLFVFSSEERMRQDGNTLLCLLLFHPFMLGSPSNMDLSLPHLVTNRMSLPFTCKEHWHTSKHASPDIAKSLMSDKWCKNSIQIHWNSVWFGGFSELLKWNEVQYSKEDSSQFHTSLHLTSSDLEMLKSSSIDYGVSKCLTNIQNGTCHVTTVDNINKLERFVCGIKLFINISMFFSYIHLLVLTKNDGHKDILKHPWETSFYRFLNAPPSTQEDMLLLISILKFLGQLIPIYTAQDERCWIVNILKTPGHLLPNLLQVESAPDYEIKLMHQELLNLITVCLKDEQHYMDLHSSKFKDKVTSNWLHIIRIISENLKLGESQHFYNLSYLDCILSCLVHLTSSLGWSNCKRDLLPQEPIPNLINALCELISAFHCGKGSAAADSLMGLSITRHITLILNHLIMEMQYTGVKGWELCFLSDSEENIIYSLCTLWLSRDIVLRASVLQLLAGLAISPRASVQLVQDVKDVKYGSNIWESMLTILLNNDEASIVRENAANVLFNLLSHYCNGGNEQHFSGQCKKSAVLLLLDLLDEFKFYSELNVILENLVHKPVININNLRNTPDAFFKDDFASVSSVPVNAKSTKSTNTKMAITPSFVKNIALFIHNLLLLGDKIINNLQEHGVVKMLFRCLLRPYSDVKNTKDLAFYCDILEMNTAICVVLSKAVGNNSICLNTVLHTRDCINVLLSLLNPNIYYIKLPQLVYLRNQLWTEIFILIGTLLDDSTCKTNVISNALPVVTYALNECGYEPFLQALCESISSNASLDLQHSALLSLTSLLRAEGDISDIQEEEIILSPSPSMKTILDTIKTPRTPLVKDTVAEKIEPEVEVLWQRNRHSLSEKHSANKFENMYFNVISNKLAEMTKKRSKSEDFEPIKKELQSDSLMAGAQLCKILLRLYDASTLKNKDKKRSMIVNTLTSILAVSNEAKKLALQNGLMELIVQQLKEIHVKLSLESVAYLRRLSDKKRICPVLKEVGGLMGLVTNFMLGDESVKASASVLGFADAIHKLWVWFCVDRSLLLDTLKMLCTFTSDCFLAAQCLPLTSAIAGTGPRKVLSNLSLLHEIVILISKEMDLISSSHDLTILELLFGVLHNSCSAIECRNVLMKSNLLQSLSRLHPAKTKKQKIWQAVESIWLEFLITLTGYNEGQLSVAKAADALEIVMMLTSSPKLSNRTSAMSVLRNIAFCHSNRPRLINSPDFIKILQTKLINGCMEEKIVTVTIIWALIANNQRAKLILKCAGLDTKLQELIKRISLSCDQVITQSNLHMMYSVLGILKEGEKVR
ncbi:hypothetical protein RN001_012584 [Aquatica leii]|uniref:Rotatin N-terminal domain-containing protein n=1 Tax=Aquatica leii TaxID=1421715 RepID=A0AAN7P434_9COLE|nr:hypothetical protein RN001_012584 [Aquatica leii]